MADDERQYMLKRLVIEEFEYDPEEIRLAMEGWTPKYASLEDRDACVMEFFDLHNGSEYGDNLFGNVNFDCDTILFVRTPEKDIYHDNTRKPGDLGDILS